MSILDIQKRTRRLGEIRLGEKGAKGQPVKLKTLRLTSVSRGLLDQAAALWGGTVEPWDTKFTLTTETDAIPVVVPPQDPNSISWYELWKAGGMVRKCDSETMILGDAPVACLCDPDNRECKPTTRVQFMLPDLEDIGVWVLRSTGFYAAAEMGAAMDLLLRQMDDTGWMPQATLAVEERVIKRQGQPTNRFVVPTLRLHSKLADLLPSGTPTPALEAGTPGEGASPPPAPLPAPSLEEPPPPDDEEPIEDVVVVDEAQHWNELYTVLGEQPADGNMKVVSARLRRLYALMEATGHKKWGDHGLHVALKQKYNVDHLGELKRDTLDVFTGASFMAAKKQIGDEVGPTTTGN